MELVLHILLCSVKKRHRRAS